MKKSKTPNGAKPGAAMTEKQLLEWAAMRDATLEAKTAHFSPAAKRLLAQIYRDWAARLEALASEPPPLATPPTARWN